MGITTNAMQGALMISRVLPHELQAAHEARTAVEALREVEEPSRVDDLRLLVSEIVTNSIRHAPPSNSSYIELRLVVTRDRILGEVTDQGTGFDTTIKPIRRDQTSGWGLNIISKLADRWGVELHDDGCRVWFELERGRPVKSW